MPKTTTVQVDPAISTFYDKVLLVRALPELCHNLFGQNRPLPTGSGDTIKFRRYNSLNPATAPLTEGITPAAVQLSKTDLTSTIKQYGNLVQITDMVEWTNQDKVLTEAATLLGENAGQSLDIIYRETLVAGTQVRYGTGVANRLAVNNKIANTDMNIVIRALENANAKHFTKMIQPMNKYASSPIRAAYWGIIHPDVHYDIQSITGWTPVHEYASQQETYPNEVGAYKNIRFIMSTYAKVFADSGAAVGGGWKSTGGVTNDVYITLIFAKNAYGICPLSGHALENIRKPRGSGTDYLDQYSTSGWKAATTIKILDDSFMYRIETTATA